MNEDSPQRRRRDVHYHQPLRKNSDIISCPGRSSVGPGTVVTPSSDSVGWEERDRGGSGDGQGVRGRERDERGGEE